MQGGCPLQGVCARTGVGARHGEPVGDHPDIGGAGGAWESARQEFEAATRPQERSCTRERSETRPKGRPQECAVQSALIRGLGTSFSLNMTGTSKQELKMHAQAEPERPKGEGSSWSGAARGKALLCQARTGRH